MHKGYDLYSAAVPVGLTAFFVRALLYQALGGTLPGGASTDLGVSSWNVANVFCFGVFGLCIVGALVLGCRPKDYCVCSTTPATASTSRRSTAMQRS